ncbi:MAG: hypothetical protein JSR97_01820 [Verrucomicrobia bacterium]|nr:hypothetical protein [Verrucomicrobiota bacterium]
MRKFITAIIFLTITFNLTAQTFQKQTNESAENFVKRIYEITELPHPVIVTKEWDTTKPVIICIVGFSAEQTSGGYIGYILTPTKDNFYQQTVIDTFWQGGGASSNEITSIFFANTDKDKQREIIVMTTAVSRSPRFADNSVVGNYYESYVYDNFDLTNPPKQLTELKKMSELFQEFDGKIYSAKTGKFLRAEKAKYKTVKSIRQKLKLLGY